MTVIENNSRSKIEDYSESGSEGECSVRGNEENKGEEERETKSIFLLFPLRL